MLVYVDESYRRADEPNCKSTFAAVCIREEKYRAFDTDLLKLKKHYWKIQAPSDLELKGRLLLSEHAIELPKNREFIRQLIALMKEHEVVPFAVVQDGSLQLSSIQGDHLPTLYRNVLRRVNRYMSEKCSANETAVLFYDSVDHMTNQRIAISFNNFMFKHTLGAQLHRVLPVLNFSDSLVTPGVQIADVIAYCANERAVERGSHAMRGHLEEFFQQFRELTFNWEQPDENFTLWGFQRVGFGAAVIEEETIEAKVEAVEAAEAAEAEAAVEQRKITKGARKE